MLSVMSAFPRTVCAWGTGYRRCQAHDALLFAEIFMRCRCASSMFDFFLVQSISDPLFLWKSPLGAFRASHSSLWVLSRSDVLFKVDLSLFWLVFPLRTLTLSMMGGLLQPNSQPLADGNRSFYDAHVQDIVSQVVFCCAGGHCRIHGHQLCSMVQLAPRMLSLSLFGPLSQIWSTLLGRFYPLHDHSVLNVV